MCSDVFVKVLLKASILLGLRFILYSPIAHPADFYYQCLFLYEQLAIL
jgi:hypothetical protein